MKKHLVRSLTARAAGILTVVLMVAATAVAGTPNLEGTYRLVSRELPDGTVKKAPEVTGLLTFTRTHRNLQVVWTGANGILCTYSLAASYNIIRGQYSEKILFTNLNDYGLGQRAGFDLVKRNQKVALVNAMEADAPEPSLDSPALIIDGNRLTTTAEGSFIDTWEKVQENSGAQAVNPD